MVKSVEKPKTAEKTKNVEKTKRVEKPNSEVKKPIIKGGKTITIANDEASNVISENVIKITVKAIENMILKQQPSEIVIQVEYMATQLAESGKISCCEGEQTAVNLNVILNYNSVKLDAFNELAENPVLFTISESPRVKSSKDMKKSSRDEKLQILGRCNLDLLPLLLGECCITECLLLEQDYRTAGEDIITWPNLPRLYVSALVDEPITTSQDILDGNILYMTVESMYNVIPKMSDNLVYTAATRLPMTSDKYQNIWFEGGFLTEYRNVDRIKRWNSLMTIQGRGTYSKYKLSDDNTDINTTLQCELLKNINKDIPHIEWNCMRRCWVVEKACKLIYNDLAKYRLWPLELLFTTKIPESTRQKTKDLVSQSMHYIAYLDFTSLLYPGVTKARTACQVYTYCQEDLKLKCDVIKPIFENTPIASPKDPSNVRKKNIDQKSGTKIQHTTMPIEEASVPLFNDQGEPLFIVVEIELMKPILRKRCRKEISNAIEAAVPSRSELPKRVINAELAEQHYRCCIQKLSELITSEYQVFMDHGHFNNISVEDITQNFSLHLQTTGNYNTMKETLRNKISVLVHEKCSDNLRPGCSDKEMQNFVSSVYIYLVEKMHTIINSFVDIGENGADLTFQLSSNDQYYFAEEATEEDNMNRAKQLYLERIAEDKKNPDKWLEYAVFCLSQGNVSKALECTKEALTLDIRHKLAMLMYGILLYQYDEHKDAELFLEALTCFYPRIAEGWMVFHLFYLQIQKLEGAEVTLQMGKKCFNKTHEHLEYLCITAESLSWNTMSNEHNSIFLSTSKVLFKLKMYAFAELALAQELRFNGSSVPYLYYLAVDHYLLHRYEKAILHLKEALIEKAQNYCLWSLMGHCYHKLKNVEKAKECYQFVVNCEDRPINIHLVNIRLGSYYLQDNDYVLARSTYLDACINTPSPLSWLGLGIACYMMNNYLDSERALTEANMLDNTCALTWGYLTLINLQYQKRAAFEQCYRQTLKHNLQDRSILQQIKVLHTDLNYPDPAPFATE